MGKQTLVRAVAVALLCACLPAHAGVVITQENVGQDAEGQVKKRTDTTSIEGNRQVSTGEWGVMILDLDKGVVITTIDQQKTYNETPLKGSMFGMGAAMASQMKYKPKGTHKTVAGYSCDEYDVDMGMAMIQQTACFSSSAPGAKEFEALGRKMLQVMGSQPPASLPAGVQLMQVSTTQPPDFSTMFKDNPEMAKQMQEKAKTLKPTVHSTTVTSIKAQAVPASAFAVPAGYKKTDNMFGAPPK